MWRMHLSYLVAIIFAGIQYHILKASKNIHIHNRANIAALEPPTVQYSALFILVSSAILRQTLGKYPRKKEKDDY